MKKLLLSFMVILAAFSFVGINQSVYADDIPVTFRVRNHAAEIRAENIANGMELKISDTIPDTIITYKNATRSVVKVVKNGEVISNENYGLVLSNEEQSIIIDLSDIELDYGDYTIEVSGFNADDDEVRADDINFKVVALLAPSVPDTGMMEKFEDGGGIHFETVIPTIIVLAAIAFWVINKIKRGLYQ